MAQTEDLIAFWKAMPFGENVHPDDAAVLSAERHRLETGYVPGPWYGAITKAKVFCLYLNPGMDPELDPTIHRDRQFDMLSRRRLQGEDVERELVARNRHLGSPGHKWLNSRFRGVATSDGLADYLALLNLVPYKSQKFKDYPLVDKLPSARLVRSVLHDNLLPRARREEIMVVAVRGARPWGLADEQQTDYVRILRGGECRGGYLTANTSHGRRIGIFLATGK